MKSIIVITILIAFLIYRYNIESNKKTTIYQTSVGNKGNVQLSTTLGNNGGMNTDVTEYNSEILKYIKFSKEVENALNYGLPILALESTIISHGMPYPQNYHTAKDVETIVREQGVVPATIAIINGTIHVGLTDSEIHYLSKFGKSSVKTSRRDLSLVVAQGKTGSTTVSSTIFISSLVGIKIFVTGGLGGVHRNADVSMDISADLTELGKNSVTVVCAGVKSILDIGKTLEYLETQGVTIISYQTDQFPAFFTADSGFESPNRMDDTFEIAKVIHANHILNLKSGIVIAVPNDAKNSELLGIDQKEINKAIAESIQQSEIDSIKGKDITPYLLKMVNDKTKGKSLLLNIQLIKNNAKIGSEIAINYYKLKTNNNNNNFKHLKYFSLDQNNQLLIKQVDQEQQLIINQQPQLNLQQQNSDINNPYQIINRDNNNMLVINSRLNKNYDVIIIGGSVIDMISHPNRDSGFHMETSNPGKIEIKMGGVGRNIAEVLCRLDQNPLFISLLGNDHYGKILLDHYSQIKLSTYSQIIDDYQTAVYNAILNEKGDLSVAISQMDIFNQITPNYLKQFESTLSQAKIIVLDGNIPVESMQYIASLTTKYNIKLWFEPTSHFKSMKPIKSNITSSITYTSPNRDELLTMSKELIRFNPKLSDLIKNHDDMDLESIKSHSKVLIESGIKFIITKLGSDGMLLSYKDSVSGDYKFEKFNAPHVDRIIDVTGAGDSLVGGVIFSLLNNMNLSESIKIGGLCAKASLESSYPVSPKLSKIYLNTSPNK